MAAVAMSRLRVVKRQDFLKANRAASATIFAVRDEVVATLAERDTGLRDPHGRPLRWANGGQSLG
jgi:hypothetical protein